MNIKEMLQKSEAALSFEVFPPKTEAAYLSVHEAARAVAALHPAFISVTCGAGGSTDGYTGLSRPNCKKISACPPWRT